MKSKSIFLILTLTFNYTAYNQEFNTDSLHNNRLNITQPLPLISQPTDFEPNYSPNNQKYLQSFKFSVGYSSSTNRSNNYLMIYSDTSRNTITINQSTPVLSFSHNIVLGNTFSIGYSIGYQKMEIEFNHSIFSSFKAFVFVNPTLRLFSNKRLSGYSKLNLGLVYEDARVELLKSNAMTYYLPPHFKVYTGFTPIGISFKISKQMSLNSELSIWSFESINFGIKYNFNKNQNYSEN